MLKYAKLVWHGLQKRHDFFSSFIKRLVVTPTSVCAHSIGWSLRQEGGVVKCLQLQEIDTAIHPGGNHSEETILFQPFVKHFFFFFFGHQHILHRYLQQEQQNF